MAIFLCLGQSPVCLRPRRISCLVACVSNRRHAFDKWSVSAHWHVESCDDFNSVAFSSLVSAPTFHRYELPLTNGNVRRGLLLQCGGAWGDAAPLQGWSSETCDDLVRYLSNDPNLDTIPASLPSLHCAMEGVMASAENFQHWPILHNEVPINAHWMLCRIC